jgi:uncharacterized UPF0160 family protein
MTRDLYLKFEVNTLRNKELIVEKLKKFKSEILKFRLFVAIATRIFNIGRKEKDVHNLQTAIYP